MTMSRRALSISGIILLSCILARVALANTELLDYVHPLIYSSISSTCPTELFQQINGSNINYDGDNDLVRGGEECVSFLHEQAKSWLGWFSLTLGAMAASFLKWYSRSLETCPTFTKSVTSGFMGALGDLLAQAVEAWTETAKGGCFRWRRDLNLRRVLAVAAEGLCISGPLMIFAYDLMEEHLPIYNEGDEERGSDLHSWIMVFCQVIIDMILIDTICVVTLLITTALLEGRAKDIQQEMALSFIPAVKVSWLSSLCWSPVQTLSFKYVPFNYRVFAINCQDIAWNASISFVAHKHRERHPTEKDPQLDEVEQPSRPAVGGTTL